MLGRFTQYLAAAFNARPQGMFVPPNWIGLGAFALLGTLNPGLWLVGLGLELAYVTTLVGSTRFRAVVDGQHQARGRGMWATRTKQLVQGLDSASQIRYQALEQRCRAMIDDPGVSEGRETRASLGGALAQLLWLYLQLLSARQTTVRLLQGNEAALRQRPGSLSDRKAELDRRLAGEKLDPDLKRSLEGQRDLLDQRLATQQTAGAKVEFIDAELLRIEEQVQLVREQAVLASDPEVASRRIDAIQSTLDNTTQWIRDQNRVSGELADALEGAPPELESGPDVSQMFRR